MASVVCAGAHDTVIKNKVCEPDQVNMVIFHAACSDGFAAAHSAWLRLGDKAQYFGASHEEKSKQPPDVKNKVVVILDFSYDLATTKQMMQDAQAVLVIDHHASAESTLSELPDSAKVFEMKQSGATLSWNFFHPGEQVPAMYRYIEDRDIWRWTMPDAKSWSAAYDTEVYQDVSAMAGDVSASVFETHPFHKAFLSGAEGIDRYVRLGRAVLSYQRSVIQQHVDSAVLRQLKDFPFTAQVVNATVLGSDIGNALSGTKGSGLAILTSILPDGRIKCSLRSQFGSQAGAADVSEIARFYGGGGHKAASSFVCDSFAAYESLFK